MTARLINGYLFFFLVEFWWSESKKKNSLSEDYITSRSRGKSAALQRHVARGFPLVLQG
jgi:hypothetical protein